MTIPQLLPRARLRPWNRDWRAFSPAAIRNFIKQIPRPRRNKVGCIIQKSHRNPFDHQLRNTGIKLVVIETREELSAAVNEKTAIMHFSNFANASGQIKVDEWVKLGKN